MPGHGLAVSHCFDHHEFSPLDISGLGLWIDADLPSTLWEDTTALTPATASDTVALAQDRTTNARHFSTGTGANEPTLVAWDATREALFWADSTDILDGNTAAKTLTNAALGYTVCVVVELPPVLGTLRHIVRMTLAGGTTKAVLYQETNAKIYMSTRRVAGDSVSTLGDPSTVVVGGNRYIIIASVDWVTGAGVIEVNGAITGQGISGTFAWTPNAAGSEASDSQIFSLSSGAQPFTLGATGEVLAYTKALSAGERQFVRNYLNSKWTVY